jgi:flagellar biosynthesis chaperone FliJ
MDKLAKVLKVRAQREQESAVALAKSKLARAQAQAQQQQLDELTAHYRHQHGEVMQASVHRFSQFQRFYRQLAVAVAAQREIVERLVATESRDTADFITLHKDRRALEELLKQRELTHKTGLLRAARRLQGQPQRDPMV